MTILLREITDPGTRTPLIDAKQHLGVAWQAMVKHTLEKYRQKLHKDGGKTGKLLAWLLKGNTPTVITFPVQVGWWGIHATWWSLNLI